MSAPTSRESCPSWTLPSTRTMMRSLSTESTTPARLQMTTAPESRAVTRSMPVPTYGDSARSSGTAWRCMFDPISARLASSFSRNGIRLAATETSCLGLTSMYSISPTCFSTKLPAWRALTSSAVMLAFFVQPHIGLRDDVLVFFPRREVIAMRLEFGGLLLARARLALSSFGAR